MSLVCLRCSPAVGQSEPGLGGQWQDNKQDKCGRLGEEEEDNLGQDAAQSWSSSGGNHPCHDRLPQVVAV